MVNKKFRKSGNLHFIYKNRKVTFFVQIHLMYLSFSEQFTSTFVIISVTLFSVTFILISLEQRTLLIKISSIIYLASLQKEYCSFTWTINT